MSDEFYKALAETGEKIKNLIEMFEPYVSVPEEKREILDEEEKEYLRAVIKPFRDRVKYIIKIKGCMENEYIAIYIKSINEDSERVALPYFEKNTMYKGMEVSEKYSLEELGL